MPNNEPHSTQWGSGPRAGNAPSAPGPALEARNIDFQYSESLPTLLAELPGALLLSTHTTGNVIVLSTAQGKLHVAFHTFERPMGIAVRPGWLVVGTRTQVWSLRNAPDVAGRVEPRGCCDACYISRFSHFTGDIRCHEMAWVETGEGDSPMFADPRREHPAKTGAVPTVRATRPELWIVNTRFSCLCTVHSAYHFAPRWQPAFITALTPEDRCHLNGLAVAGGKPRFVTALAESDRPDGWRAAKIGGGCVIDVASKETVCRGLVMAHSPRLAAGRLLALQSGLGQLITVDPDSGRWETITTLPGYTRGLAVAGNRAFVGLSKIRPGSSLDGVPIAARPEQLKCGFAVVDLKAGGVIGHFEFSAGIDELFDVQVLAGARSPLLVGPFADRGPGPQVWTAP